MSPSTLCRELPLEELILLARHASRVSGYISLKALAEYFPSLDMKTHLDILESLLRTGHIKRSIRGYYAFKETESILEADEVNEELRALADAKKIVQRVRVNLPPSVTKKEQKTPSVASTVVDANHDNDHNNNTNTNAINNNNNNGGTIRGPEPVEKYAIQEASLKVEESRKIILNPPRTLAVSNLKPGASSTPKCNGSQNVIDPRTISGNSTFTAEARLSAQGIKRKLDSCRNAKSSVSPDTHTPAPASSPALPSATPPETSEAAPDALAESMAALKLAPREHIPSQAPEDRKDADGSGDFIDVDSGSKSSTGSLDPSAPEFTPNSFALDGLLQSTTLAEHVEVVTRQEDEDKDRVQNAEIAVKSKMDGEQYPSTSEDPRTHVNLLPPAPKPKPKPIQFPAQRALPKTSVGSGSATSSRGSLTPPYFRARDEAASKFHWTKKKTGEEVEDPCEALEIFCRHNRLKAPSYKVIFLPSDDAYLCMLMVGTEPFKSYPTLSRTTKRAREVAAEKAVAALGITASMVARCRESRSPSLEL